MGAGRSVLWCMLCGTCFLVGTRFGFHRRTPHIIARMLRLPLSSSTSSSLSSPPTSPPFVCVSPPFFSSLQLSIDCLPPSCSQLSFARSVSLAFALPVLSLTRQVFVGRNIDDTGKAQGKMKATRNCGGSASGGDESGCKSTRGGQEEGLEDECVARRALLYWHEMRSFSLELH